MQTKKIRRNRQHHKWVFTWGLRYKTNVLGHKGDYGPSKNNCGWSWSLSLVIRMSSPNIRKWKDCIQWRYFAMQEFNQLRHELQSTHPWGYPWRWIRIRSKSEKAYNFKLSNSCGTGCKCMESNLDTFQSEIHKNTCNHGQTY